MEVRAGAGDAVRGEGQRGGFGREFYAGLQRGGQLTVPPEVVVDEELEVGDIVEVTLEMGQ